MTDTKIPSELVISQKWDKLLERVAINAGTGFVIGLCASFVFTRGYARAAGARPPSSRALRTLALAPLLKPRNARRYRLAMSTFGAGTGVGMAYEKSSAEFSQR